MEDKERTLYCGNLSDKVTEDLLYELFLQAGPLENVTIPKDKDGRQRNFGFIAFKHAVSVPYAVALMNGMSLYGKPLKLDARSGSNEVNPYLQQLQEYMFNAQRRLPTLGRGYAHNVPPYYNDDRFPVRTAYVGRQADGTYAVVNDVRINEPRTNNIPNPIMYPGFVQSYIPNMLPQLPLPPVNNYSYLPRRHDNYKSPRSNYRR